MHHLSNITNQEIGPTTPYMLRFAGVEKSASWFQWGANFGLLVGNASGLIGEETTDSVEFGIFSAEFGGGCHITPLGHQQAFPFQPYLGLGGVLDMAMILLQSGTAPNDPKSPHHLGYALSVGAYIHITQTFGINLQVEQTRFLTGAKGEAHFLDGDRFLITFFKEMQLSPKPTNPTNQNGE